MATISPSPAFIFRGHASAIHALHFFADNKLLASGDSDGWIVIWSLASKRPVAVWKGHDGGIMAIQFWVTDRLLSHGRDHILRVWQLRVSHIDGLSIKLPVDGATAEENKQPWLLHAMAANALNYCAFSLCRDLPNNDNVSELDGHDAILIATPNGLDTGGVDIFQLPSQKRVNQIPSRGNEQSGMVMALSLFQESQQRRMTLIAGFENGHVRVLQRTTVGSEGWFWEILMSCEPHTQPVLSIDISPDFCYFVSSSADARISKWTIPTAAVDKAVAAKISDTKHAGQQDITIRDDGRIFATAGWDKRVRVYSLKTLKELAVLKWHKEGCYAVAFAATVVPDSEDAVEDEHINTALAKTTSDLMKDDRNRRAQNTHWLAAGGKDGKISLWDIY